MDEYIEREALKEAFCADTQHIRDWDVSLYDLLMQEIDEVPAADVAPVVHGRWIFDHMTGERSYYARCSNCNRMRFFERKESEPQFCDMCGAKMDKEEK